MNTINESVNQSEKDNDKYLYAYEVSTYFTDRRSRLPAKI